MKALQAPCRVTLAGCFFRTIFSGAGFFDIIKCIVTGGKEL